MSSAVNAEVRNGYVISLCDAENSNDALKKGASYSEVLSKIGSPIEKIEKEISRIDIWSYKNLTVSFKSGKLNAITCKNKDLNPNLANNSKSEIKSALKTELPFIPSEPGQVTIIENVSPSSSSSASNLRFGSQVNSAINELKKFSVDGEDSKPSTPGTPGTPTTGSFTGGLPISPPGMGNPPQIQLQR